MSLNPFMPLHLGSDIENKVICWAVEQIWYGESWDDIWYSCHSETPELALSQYRRISWHWFQGLRHDSYLDINFVIIRSHGCCHLLKCWYLGKLSCLRPWNQCQLVRRYWLNAKSGVAECQECRNSSHFSPYQISLQAQQFILFPMSEPRCNGINGSSDIDLPWFESRTRSILAVLMLKSPD